jgi:hypothetical protein
MHCVYEIGYIFKASSIMKRPAYAFALGLKFVCANVGVLVIGRELRHVKPPCPPDRQRQSQRLVPIDLAIRCKRLRHTRSIQRTLFGRHCVLKKVAVLPLQR